MAYYPPEVIQKAKQMDLLTYLKNYEPEELVHFSRDTYTTRTHDSLKYLMVCGIGFLKVLVAKVH